MTTVEIPSLYNGFIRADDAKGSPPYVGWVTVGKSWFESRGFYKWSLDFLPASPATVTQLRVRITVTLAGGSGHLTDIHPYGGDGYTYDPEVDTTWAVLGARCIAGTEYIDNSTAFQSTGDKWFDLGSAACQDIMDAKVAGNRYSIGMHEDSGLGKAAATLWSIAILEITISDVYVIYVTSDYVRDIIFDSSDFIPYTIQDQNVVGAFPAVSPYLHYRTVHRFPLPTLPSGSTVDQLVLREIVKSAGGANHELDIHPYNADGQADPEDDTKTDVYARIALGTEYFDDSQAYRSIGHKYFTFPAQARTDLANANNAVNRFSLGFHEEGDDDYRAIMQGEPGDDYYPQVMIVYTPPTFGGSILPQIPIAKTLLSACTPWKKRFPKLSPLKI